MKNFKHLKALFIVILAVLMAFALAACNGETPAATDLPTIADAAGIATITKTATQGVVDTWTVTFNDGSTCSFTVTNGTNGAAGAQGIQGIQGIQGVKGEDGVTPTIAINESGKWVINGIESSVSAIGVKGDKGDKGDPGDQGIPGAAGLDGAAGTNGTDGVDGTNGTDGVSITNVQKTSSDGLVDTYTITYSDGKHTTFTITNGAAGAKGNDGSRGAQGPAGTGIASISKTNTVGNVDTYTITFTNNDIATFTVTNGTAGVTGTDGNGIKTITISDGKFVIEWTEAGKANTEIAIPVAEKTLLEVQQEKVAAIYAMFAGYSIDDYALVKWDMMSRYVSTLIANTYACTTKEQVEQIDVAEFKGYFDEVKSTAWDGIVSEETPMSFRIVGDTVYIDDSEGFAFFAETVRQGMFNGYEGMTVILTEDIDLNNQEWSPIGGEVTTTTASTGIYGKVSISAEKSFKGTFNGSYHYISGMSMTNNHGLAGALFSSTDGAVIKNLNLDVNMTETGSVRASYAALVGIATDTYFENVEITGRIDASRVAGLANVITFNSEPTKYIMKNCDVSADMTTRSTGAVIAGGLVQQLEMCVGGNAVSDAAATEILFAKDCGFSGRILVTTASESYFVWVGQLFGSTSYSAPPQYYTLVVEDFNAAGTLVVSEFAKTALVTSTAAGKFNNFNGIDEMGNAVIFHSSVSNNSVFNYLGRCHINLGLKVVYSNVEMTSLEVTAPTTIYGNYNIPAGFTLTNANGNTITVAAGGAVTGDGTFQNNGELVIEVATYDALVAAIEVADVVKLATDITPASAQSLNVVCDDRDYDFTLDLNGFRLNTELKLFAAHYTSYVGGVSGSYANFSDGEDGYYSINLEIKNGTIGNNTFEFADAGTFVGCYYGIRVYANDMLTLTLNGVTANGYYGGLQTNGSYAGGSTITATDCTFFGNDAETAGAYLAGKHTYAFTGCSFSGYTGLYIKSGDTTLTNCIATGTGAVSEARYNGSGANPTGSAIVVDSAKGYQSPMSVTIVGGTFNSENNYAIEEFSTAAVAEDATCYATVSVDSTASLSGALGTVRSVNDVVSVAVN